MPESIFIRPHRSRKTDEGTIELSVSIYDDEGHTSAVMEVRATNAECAFWNWILGQQCYAKSLNEQAVTEARSEYARFCEWRDNLNESRMDKEQDLRR
jgi:hypothetical protein